MTSEMRVPLLSLVALNGGRGMIDAGERFYEDLDRAAELITLEYADLLTAPDDVERAVAERLDRDDMRALREAHNIRLIVEAWCRGMRPA